MGYSESEDAPVLIKFLGVWDTVDAYGLPVDELTRAWDRVIWPLTAKDRELSPRVERACHALALDEQRESFEPMLWNEGGKLLGKKINGEHASQVWFAGVHSNVGGGYPDDALAFVALDWMLTESSRKNGLSYLETERDRHRELADVKGPLYDSRSGVGNVYRYAPRRLERLCNEEKPGLWNWIKSIFGLPNVEKNEVQIVKPKIHYSVFERIAESDAYAPINIPEDYAVVGADGKITDVTAMEPASSPPFETAAMAHSRRGAQSLVWNKVWGRKLLFYLILTTTMLFLTYPYMPWMSSTPIADFLEPILGWFSFVIPAIPDLVGKIPGLGFAEGWATKYASHPYVFTIGILLIAGLLTWSLKVNAALNSEMRRNWDLITGTTRPNGPPPGTFQEWMAGAITKVRIWLAARLDDVPVAAAAPKLSAASKLSRLFRIGTEGLALGLFFALVIAIGSRLFFVVGDGAGAICDPIQKGRELPFGKTFKFNPKSTCFDTGHKLVQGRTYAMEFRLHASWSDDRNTADLNGLSAPSWIVTLSTPLRRHLFLPWYQPVARVDDELFDRHPLLPADTEGSSKTAVRMQFKARRSGRLYLYVNDAVFFAPGLVEFIYDNNTGYACVNVTEVESDPHASSEDTFTSIGELAPEGRSCELKEDKPAKSVPALPSGSADPVPEG